MRTVLSLRSADAQTAARLVRSLPQALCGSPTLSISKVLSVAFLALLVFGAGYLTAKWRFVYGQTWKLEESITVEAGAESGVLPAGTELHYQSRAHGEIDFYVFVRIPQDKATEMVSRVEVDAYYGIKRLRGDFD